ncbi:MAG: phosphogluconate dehydrogenase (NAD(+)-dependent, decarboxylating) [Armatimonadota bacterium]
MNIIIAGLGKMGLGMAQRLSEKKHQVYGYDVDSEKMNEIKNTAIMWLNNPEDISNIPSPKVLFIMVPAGELVDSAIESFLPYLNENDVVIDGGNSNYKNSIERHHKLLNHKIQFLDAGISGGVWGKEKGYCMMVGGDKDAYNLVEPILIDLAPENGVKYVGKSGAGHYLKMVHNGIEYGMLQAYAEGFEILKCSQFDYNFEDICSLWNNGSVVRSWLLELAELAFAESGDLNDIRGWVEDSGEGRWTILESIEQSVPAPVIALSLMMRFRSRQEDPFSSKVIAALRKQFGGHSVKKIDE